MENYKEDDIAIIGISGAFAAAKTVQDFWKGLVSGKDYIRKIPKNRRSLNIYEQMGIPVKELEYAMMDDPGLFDAGFFGITEEEALRMDPQLRQLLEHSCHAIQNAGYSLDHLKKIRSAVLLSVGVEGYKNHLFDIGFNDIRNPDEIAFCDYPDIISRNLNTKGYNTAIHQRCIGTITALNRAKTLLSDHELVIVGASYIHTDLTTEKYYSENKLKSSTQRCQSFSAHADGLGSGEGTGVLILKSLNKAIASHDFIYGVLKSAKSAYSGKTSSLLQVHPTGLSDLIVETYREAGIDPEDVCYIEAHGGGNKYGDAIEMGGIKLAFKKLSGPEGNNKKTIGFGSVKSNMGDIGTCAGMDGIMKILMSLQYKKIPPTLHCHPLSKDLVLANSPFYITDSEHSGQLPCFSSEKPVAMGINSYNLTGGVAHAVIQEYKSDSSYPESNDPQLICFSAKTTAALTQYLTRFLAFLENKEYVAPERYTLTNIAYTLQTGRSFYRYRIVFIADSISGLCKQISTYINTGKESKSCMARSAPLKKRAKVLDKQKLNTWIEKEQWNEIAESWLDQYAVDWDMVNRDVPRYRVPLPGYAFDHSTSFWPEFPHTPKTVIPSKTNGFSEIETTSVVQPQNNKMTDESLKSNFRKSLQKFGIQDFKWDDELEDYEWTSVAVTGFSESLRDQYQVALTPADFYQFRTFSDIINHIQSLLPEVNKEVSDLQPVKTRKVQQILPSKKRANSDDEYTPIAIVGMSGRFPMADNLDEYWNNLLKAKDCISEIPKDRWDWKALWDEQEDPEKCPVKWGGFCSSVDRFDPRFFDITPAEAEVMDPQQRWMLEETYHALEDAGISPQSVKGSDTGVFIGCSSMDYNEVLQTNPHAAAGYQSIGLALSVVANRISYFFDLVGPSEVVDTACSSSLVAIHHAVTAIRSGQCSKAIAGGVSALITPRNFQLMSSSGALSEDGRCKTFSKDANGYVRGEGCAAIVLMPLEEAIRNRHSIYGVIRHTHQNHGGRVTGITVPNPNMQAKLIEDTYSTIGIPVDSVGYIETHGTGTKLGDPVEINGLKMAFQSLYNQQGVALSKEAHCGLGAVKSNIGHLEAASGIAGVVKVLLKMKHQLLVKSLHCEEINPYIQLEGSPFRIIREKEPWKRLRDTEGNELPFRGGVSSFGFGGANAHVLIEEYIDQFRIKNEEFRIEGPAIIVLSAKNRERLKEVAKNLLNYLTIIIQNSEFRIQNLHDIAYTLQFGREAMEERLAIVADNIHDLKEQLIRYEEDRSDDLIADNIKKSKVNFVLKGKAGKAYIKEAIASKEPESLAQLWVSGVTIDWNLLYSDQQPQKISLPVYPFAKERYWVPDGGNDQKFYPVQKPVRKDDKTELYNNHNGLPVIERITVYLKNKIAAATKIPAEEFDIHEELQNYRFDSILINKLNTDLEKVIGKKDPALFFSSASIHELAKNIEKKYKEHFLNALSSKDEKVKSAAFPILTSSRAVTENGHETVTKNRDIAIIGIAGKYPQADDLHAFFDNLKKGRDCIEEIPAERWNYAEYYNNGREKGNGKMSSKWGGFIRGASHFDHEHFNISLQEAVMMHPEERLLLEQAWHCFENAGYNPLSWKEGKHKETVGVYIGASFHEYQHIVSESNTGGKTYFPYTSQIYSYANRLSYYYNLRGPSVAMDTACSSSLYAIYDACTAIRSGNCDMALAGGVNLNIHPSKYIVLSEYNFMATDGRCRAFAEGGTGYVPGEGIGLVLLKNLDQAVKDNDHILAVIKGVASGNDGKTNGFTVPNPESQGEVIDRALRDGNTYPGTITLVECHGTGTSLGDPIEISALTDTYARYTEKLQYCAVSSVKSNIGHLEAAAGIAQVAKVVLQLKNKLLFPNVMHSDRLNANISFSETPFYVQKELTPWDVNQKGAPRRAGISSFGAGGTNVHLILEEYISKAPEKSGSGEDRYHILPFSADSEAQLYEIIEDMYHYLASEEANVFRQNYTLHTIAGVLQSGRHTKNFRLAVLIKGSVADFTGALKRILGARSRNEELNTNDTVLYGVLKPQEKATDINSSLYNDLSKEQLLKMASLWTRGAVVDWKKITGEYAKVALPGYRFRDKHIDLNKYRASQETPTTYEASDIKNIDSKAELKQLINVIFEEVLGEIPSHFNDKTDFADYDIDSITGSRIHARLAKFYNGLDEFVLLEYTTIDALADHIMEKYHNKSVIKENGLGVVQDEDEDKEIGSINTLFENTELNNETIIPFSEFISAYEASGGKQSITTKRIEIRPGKQLELVTAGEGPPILFMLPFNTTAVIWINQLIHFSGNFKVIVIHYPGIGGSDWIDELKSFEDLAGVITEVIDKLVVQKFIADKKLVMAGWSFGGFLIQTMAEKYPDYVKSLILISTTTISWSSKEYTISGEEFSEKSAEEISENYRKLPLFIRKMPVIQNLRKSGQIASFVVGTSDKTVINRYFLMIARFRHLDAALKIKCKTYLISGSDDELMPARFARELHKKIKNSEYYEVEGGKHFLGMFKKEIVNKKIYGWLKSIFSDERPVKEL